MCFGSSLSGLEAIFTGLESPNAHSRRLLGRRLPPSPTTILMQARRWLRDRSRSRLREATVLQKLTEEIAECYGLARDCRERAERALDPATKNDLLDQERRWLSLAHSSEYGEALPECTRRFRRKIDASGCGPPRPRL